MKKLSSQMRSTITVLLAYVLAYFPLWIALVTFIAIEIVEALKISSPWDGLITLGILGSHLLFCGIYHLLGAILEFRIAHCMLQAFHRRSYRHQEPNPLYNVWTKTEKVELIVMGILYTVIALACLALPIIDIILAK